MLKISDKHQCSGCGACADVCPVNCIEYSHDALGFIYPKIDATKCINCGSCDRVCPIKPENLFTRKATNCFAAWANDETVHKTSSSGGLGYILSKSVIDRGGIVYGCSAESPMHIRHIRVDNDSKLALLQGSKYVQSDTRGIYKAIKEDIRKGKEVLIIGTPCQVAAVRNLFRKYPENLYTVDLICHGVPSQKMLNEQIRTINRGEPQTISFRNGNDFCLRLRYAGKEDFNGSVWSVPYYKAFFKGYSYRPSCYSCPYAGSKRIGDITVGDFWGIKNQQNLPEISRNGISVVLVSTDKGQSLLDTVRPSLAIQTRPIEEAVSGNDQLQHPVKNSFRAKFFRTLYPALPLRSAVLICVLDQKFITFLKIAKRKIKR